MNLRRHHRLASAEAALMLTDLMASCHRDIVGMKLVDGKMRVFMEEEQTKSLEETKVKIAERMKDLAPPKQKLNVGRNEPCPCGSGVKFKRCCIRKT